MIRRAANRCMTENPFETRALAFHANANNTILIACDRNAIIPSYECVLCSVCHVPFVVLTAELAEMVDRVVGETSNNCNMHLNILI